MLGCNGAPHKSRGPVLANESLSSQWAIVGEYPAKGDLERGVNNFPFSGSEGMLLNRVLDELGYARTRFSTHYALACRPLQGDYKKAIIRWRKENKRRASEGLDTLPHPIECCKPRLLAETRREDAHNHHGERCTESPHWSNGRDESSRLFNRVGRFTSCTDLFAVVRSTCSTLVTYF